MSGEQMSAHNIIRIEKFELWIIIRVEEVSYLLPFCHPELRYNRNYQDNRGTCTRPSLRYMCRVTETGHSLNNSVLFLHRVHHLTPSGYHLYSLALNMGSGVFRRGASDLDSKIIVLLHQDCSNRYDLLVFRLTSMGFWIFLYPVITLYHNNMYISRTTWIAMKYTIIV